MVFKKLTRSCVERPWPWIVVGVQLVCAKARKCPPGVAISGLRVAIRKFRIFPILEFMQDCDPTGISTLNKIDPDNASFRFLKNPRY